MILIEFNNLFNWLWDRLNDCIMQWMTRMTRLRGNIKSNIILTYDLLIRVHDSNHTLLPTLTRSDRLIRLWSPDIFLHTLYNSGDVCWGQACVEYVFNLPSVVFGVTNFTYYLLVWFAVFPLDTIYKISCQIMTIENNMTNILLV